MTMRRLILIAAPLLLGFLGLIVWLCSSRLDPREVVLGDWQEASSHIRVEVTPDRAAARGIGRRAVVKYEWVQTEREPYRLQFHYHGEVLEALVYISNKDTVIVEPQIWEQLPEPARQHIQQVNRQRNRPERELRFLFHRREGKAS